MYVWRSEGPEGRLPHGGSTRLQPEGNRAERGREGREGRDEEGGEGKGKGGGFIFSYSLI